MMNNSRRSLLIAWAFEKVFSCRPSIAWQQEPRDAQPLVLSAALYTRSFGACQIVLL